METKIFTKIHKHKNIHGYCELPWVQILVYVQVELVGKVFAK